MYFIHRFDGVIVGNLKGYHTHNSALRAFNCRYKQYPNLRSYIWRVFYASQQAGNKSHNVYSIKEKELTNATI